MEFKYKIIILIESTIGLLIYRLLDRIRRILAWFMKVLNSWDRANILIVMLVKKLFKNRILLRVAIGNLRFNIRWPSVDLNVLNEVLKKKCYCLVSSFEPRKGDVVIDLGAFIGDYTVYAAKKGAFVIAVEPASTNLRLLLCNILLNKVNGRVKVLKLAVGRARRYVNFPVESIDFNPGTFSLYYVKNTWVRYEKVPVAALDDIITLTDTARVDIVKVDIEGAEEEVLQGASKLLSLYKPKFVFEIHSKKALRRILRKLRTLKYEVWLIPLTTPYRWYLYAKPAATDDSISQRSSSKENFSILQIE